MALFSEGINFQTNVNMNFPNIKTLVFIGGGDLMLKTIKTAREKGFKVGVILSNRHSNEKLESGDSLIKLIQKEKIPVVVESSPSDIDPKKIGDEFVESLAICFGPAWIFPSSVIDRFTKGMLNFNGIPLPHYLGGAHYTWQILNNHRSGGCHIQLITEEVDKGDLLMSKSFEISEEAKIPNDYFVENEKHSIEFLGSFLERIHNEHDFKLTPFKEINNQRLYFPRLITKENGWIDWSWSGEEIERFCHAFGSPYDGASTCYDGERIFLKEVEFIDDISAGTFHPYCYGLIVRIIRKEIFVAVQNGLLKIRKYEKEKIKESKTGFHEGDRFYTDSKYLNRSKKYRPKISPKGELGD